MKKLLKQSAQKRVLALTRSQNSAHNLRHMIETSDAFFRPKSDIFRLANCAAIDVFSADFFCEDQLIAIFTVKNNLRDRRGSFRQIL